MRHANQISRENNCLLQSSVVMDLAELTKSQLKWLPYFKIDTEYSELVCPEYLNHCIVVNTPWFFNMIWKIVKPWLDPRTLAKTHILGNDTVRRYETENAHYYRKDYLNSYRKRMYR